MFSETIEESVFEFVNQRIDRTKTGKVMASDLYDEYVAYCKHKKYEPYGKIGFTKIFKRAVMDDAIFYPRRSGRFPSWFKGVEIKK